MTLSNDLGLLHQGEGGRIGRMRGFLQISHFSNFLSYSLAPHPPLTQSPLSQLGAGF